MTLLAPIHFALVVPGVYRCGYPSACHIPFLERLQLKTMICLSFIPYDDPIKTFATQQGIELIQLPMRGLREPSQVTLDDEIVTRVLLIISDPKQRPVLIHCDKGQHRVGLLCACLRRTRICKWPLIAACEEYFRFVAVNTMAAAAVTEVRDDQWVSRGKAIAWRTIDVVAIESYDTVVVDEAFEKNCH